MLGSYAADDHHVMPIKPKMADQGSHTVAVGNGCRTGLMSSGSPQSDSRQVRSAIAEGTSPTSFLF
jgi:hypothetical protein